ncbi:hypothetical protein GSH19_05210 [Lactobacillus sp. S2-2]|uniref:XkdQ/YqbQ family protein n=1 Tax=Lactobacillus sp. S2-2 TaxID=2692917 RepID=UPI001F21AE2F|nr:hypothetical protein [Lactobacillus sp. S2-2]MCF6515551.1 hypothetical protein [Lactobacillus sp. S2-2]
MITKLEMRSRNSKNKYDLKNAVSDVKLTTDMNYTAGQLDFSIISTGNYRVKNGDIVIFNWSKNKTFYGYVFKWDVDEKGKITVLAYDKLRYLKNNDSIVMPVGSISSRFKTIAKRAQIKAKVVKSSSHKLKSELFDNKSYFDILKSGIKATYRATGTRYFLKDNYGTVELRKYPYKTLKLSLGDNYSVISYKMERSIDNAANYIKVVNDDSSTSKKKVTSIKMKKAKGNSVSRWGQLTYVDKATGKTNAAQMKERAKKLLKQKNKQTNSLSLTTLGHVDLIAGNSVVVNIKDLKKVGVGKKRFLIKKATHTFGTKYTVDLELSV